MATKLLKNIFLILLLLLFLGSSPAMASDQKSILLLKLDDSINPVSANYLVSEIKGAQGKYQLIIIQINTPGGGDRSMRQIIQEISASQIPVVLFVYPPGSRAASAGTFIAYACPIVAMAPGTNIGAAHPVTLGEQPEDVTMDKITNDAASFIISLAEKVGRNKEWAEKAVRESDSISAEEALRLNVINIMAKDLPDLLNQLNGMSINVNGKEITLATEGAPIVEHSPGLWYQILTVIADPNIAYILLLIGLYAIIAEVFHPTIVAGVIGAICLILAFFALETLSANVTGILLIIVAVVLFILEVKTAGFGILGIGGIIAFILGSLLLFAPPGFHPSLNTGLSIWLVAGFTGATLIFFLVVITAAIRVRNRPMIPMDLNSLYGKEGVAATDLNPYGMVFVDGTHWRAISLKGDVKKGERIRVVGRREMELEIEKEE